MSLDSSMEEPLHSVQLSSDRLVVSHGIAGSLNRVCIADIRGSIIQCYGGAAGSSVGQLNYPRQPAIDRFDNVADGRKL